VGLFDDMKNKAGDLADKAKDAVAEHDEQVGDAIDKVGDFVDDKTGGKHRDKIDKATGKAKDVVSDLGRSGRSKG
jgi:hypothetical protein